MESKLYGFHYEHNRVHVSLGVTHIAKSQKKEQSRPQYGERNIWMS